MFSYKLTKINEQLNDFKKKEQNERMCNIRTQEVRFTLTTNVTTTNEKNASMYLLSNV